MLKIKDVITMQSNFFDKIGYSLEPLSFAQLNYMFIVAYGDRYIAPILNALVVNNELSNDSLTFICQIIYNMFSYKWDCDKQIINTTYNPLDNYHETLNIKKTNENTNVLNTLNKTFAYNSINEVDKDSTNQTTNGAFIENALHEKSGLTNAVFKDIFNNALDIKAIKLCDIIFNDIKGFITLNIY